MLRPATCGVLILACAMNARAQQDADKKLDGLNENGLKFLRTQQQPDGGWQKNAKEPPALTAIALRAFVQDPRYTAKTDFVAKGFDKLLGYQLEDGGIYKDLLANYNTAIAISTLVAANEPSFQPKIDKAVEYLKRLQWNEETRPEFVSENEKNTGKAVVTGKDDPFYGGLGYGGRSRGAGRPDLSNTQLAIEALHDAGLKPDDPVFQRAIVFISRCQNNSETNKQPWAADDGGFVYGPSDDGKFESMAQPKGDNAGGDNANADKPRQLRSMGTMSYAGLKSLIYAGVGREDPRVKAGWKWVNENFTLDAHPGMADLGDEKGKWGLFYYYMTLGKALHAFGQPVITTPSGEKIDWRIALINKAAELQKPDGSWVGVNKYMEDNPVLVTSYVILSLQAARDDLKDHPAEPLTK